MASIVVKDLTENTELDRQAMLAIAGGSRLRTSGSGTAGAAQAGVRRIRLFDLAPVGAGRTPARPPAR